VVTRSDLSPGYQGVQAQHAVAQFIFEHSERSVSWPRSSNYLVWLTVDDEVELMSLIVAARELGLRWSISHKPDVGWQITAIAIEPDPKAVELCRRLPLALKDVGC
jgi:hypothetical protein